MAPGVPTIEKIPARMFPVATRGRGAESKYAATIKAIMALGANEALKLQFSDANALKSGRSTIYMKLRKIDAETRYVTSVQAGAFALYVKKWTGE